MNNEYNTFESIERYLLNEMAEQERLAFEEKLAGDTALQAQTEEMRLLIEGIETRAMKEKLDSIHAGMIQDENRTHSGSRSIMRYLPWAAALALLVSVAIWLTNDTNQHWKTYYEADPGLPTLMGNNDEYKFMEGMVFYKDNQFKSAKTHWESLYTENKSDTLNYYLAMAELNLKNYAAAEPYLKKVEPGSAFYRDAQWYLALLKVKYNETAEAVELLQNLDSDRAKELLQDLQR